MNADMAQFAAILLLFKVSASARYLDPSLDLKVLV